MMKMPYFRTFFAFSHWGRVLLLLLAFLVAPLSAEAGKITVLYTGALRGELEPCGCSPGTQSGGVAFFEKSTPLPMSFVKPLLGKKVKAVSDIAGQSRSASINKKNIPVNVSVDPKAVKRGRLNILLTDRKAG